MAVSKLFRQREELKELLEASGLDEERKGKLRSLIPHMMPDGLLRLKISLMRLMMIDASQETLDEIIEKKSAPEDDSALLESVLAKVMARVDQVEEKTRKAMAE